LGLDFFCPLLWDLNKGAPLGLVDFPAKQYSQSDLLA
jgi:hypothetical protein